MHIVCPHCTTSYAIDLATLGAAGRTVRCSRCKEVWLARPEDAALAPAMADAYGQSAPLDAAAEWDALAREEDDQDTPVVDSPSISGDWPTSDGSETDWPQLAQDDAADGETASPGRLSWLRNLFKSRALRASGKPWITSGKPWISLPTACAAMGALVLALIIWRVEVVR